jgi:hypothetical protein
MEEVTFNIILIFMLVLIQLSKDVLYSIDFQLHDFQQMFNRFSMDVLQMDFRFVKWISDGFLVFGHVRLQWRRLLLIS